MSKSAISKRIKKRGSSNQPNIKKAIITKKHGRIACQDIKSAGLRKIWVQEECWKCCLGQKWFLPALPVSVHEKNPATSMIIITILNKLTCKINVFSNYIVNKYFLKKWIYK